MGVSQRPPEALQRHELEKVLSDQVEKIDLLVPKTESSHAAAVEDVIIRQAIVHDVVPVLAREDTALVAAAPAKKNGPGKGAVTSARIRKAEITAAVPPDVVEVDSPERSTESLLMLPEPIAPEPEIVWERLLHLPTETEAVGEDPEDDRDMFEQTLHSLELLPRPLRSTDGEGASVGTKGLFEHQEVSDMPVHPIEAQREWVMEIAGEEPGQVFESFTQSLVDLIHEDAGVVVGTETGMSLQPQYKEAAKDTEQLPLIIHEVAQKLTDLESQAKENVAPVVKTLTEAVQEVRLLELGEALPAEVEVAKARVAELAEALFEALGIEYSEEALQQFIAVLLGSDFMPAPSVTAERDLEHVGTHEVKRHFPLLMAVVSDLITPLHRALGTFALTKTSPEMLQELLAGEKAVA